MSNVSHRWASFEPLRTGRSPPGPTWREAWHDPSIPATNVCRQGPKCDRRVEAVPECRSTPPRGIRPFGRLPAPSRPACHAEIARIRDLTYCAAQHTIAAFKSLRRDQCSSRDPSGGACGPCGRIPRNRPTNIVVAKRFPSGPIARSITRGRCARPTSPAVPSFRASRPPDGRPLRARPDARPPPAGRSLLGSLGNRDANDEIPPRRV